MVKLKQGELVLLLSKEHSYLVKKEKRELHTSEGIVRLDDIKEFATIVKTHKGFKFAAVKPTAIDLLNKKMKRMPASIHTKDLGFIIGQVGLDKDWKVLEAGTGSGHATLFLAQHCKQIVTYELREDFHKHVKQNLEALKVKNVTLKNMDILKAKENGYDLVLLDMQHAEKAVEVAYKALKLGGFLVIYSPYVEQVKAVVEAIQEQNFTPSQTTETILRMWDVRDHTLPKRAGMMHTAFISIARKVYKVHFK